MTTQEIIEVLNRFVGKDESRPNLLAPWSHDGWTYATDGRAMLRVPTVETILDNPLAPSKSAALLFPAQCPEASVDMPYLSEPTMQRCASCGGTGKAEADCPKCHGAGTIICDECGHNHDCKLCRGSGKAKEIGPDDCDKCHGAGKVTAFFMVQVGPHYFDAKYLRSFADLPGLRLYPAAAACDAMYLKCDIGEGILMPVRVN